MRINLADLNIDYEKVVNIYNADGRAAAQEHVLQTYGINYSKIVKTIPEKTGYVYKKGPNKYVKLEKTPDTFLSLDELCGSSRQNNPSVNSSENFITMDGMLLALLKEQLYEISKYISFSISSKSVKINGKMLKIQGYDVEII